MRKESLIPISKECLVVTRDGVVLFTKLVKFVELHRLQVACLLCFKSVNLNGFPYLFLFA